MFFQSLEMNEAQFSGSSAGDSDINVVSSMNFC